MLQKATNLLETLLKMCTNSVAGGGGTNSGVPALLPIMYIKLQKKYVPFASGVLLAALRLISGSANEISPNLNVYSLDTIATGSQLYVFAKFR